MEKPLWGKIFPRICDLYLASKRGHRDNYFEHPNVKDAFLRDPPDKFLLDLEGELNQQDHQAWAEFKHRTVPAITIKDKHGWPTQLFDHFHEARGYVYLKTQGYSGIHFLPEDSNRKTPDLAGDLDRAVALLEAKRIHESDKEEYYLRLPMEKKNMRNVLQSLPGPLKEKIRDTIRTAKTQLLSYPLQEVKRRIVFLSIRLDSNCATKAATEELALFLRHAQGEEIEIVHHLTNEFLL